MSTRISFIIPVYDVEKYLNECVDSILGQLTDDCEIILVDDFYFGILRCILVTNSTRIIW